MERKWVYRKQNGSTKDYSCFDLGYIQIPTSDHIKKHPDSCDVIVCEGFWNDENMVKHVVDVLNDYEKKSSCNICGHQNEEICNSCPDLCCGIYFENTK